MAEVFEIDTSLLDAASYCRECGTPLDDARFKYCEEHRGTRTRAQPATVAKRAARKTGKPSSSDQAKAAGTFAKLLVVITAVIAWSRLRRLQIPDFTGALAEEMSFTDDEAEPVAKVLARFTMTNSTTAKIVKPLVENDDLIDAAFALWEWNKRTEQVLSQYRQQITQDRQVVHNVPAGQSEAGAGESGGVTVPFLYDANRDGRAVV